MSLEGYVSEFPFFFDFLLFRRHAFYPIKTMVLTHSTVSENLILILKYIKKIRSPLNVGTIFASNFHQFPCLFQHRFSHRFFRCFFMENGSQIGDFGDHFCDFLMTFFGLRAKIVPGSILVTFLAPFWTPFGSLWAPFGSLWLPFVSLLVPLLYPLAPFGLPLAPFRLPLVGFGRPLGHPLAHLCSL